MENEAKIWLDTGKNVRTSSASSPSPQIFLVAMLGQICLKFVFEMSSSVIGRARG